MRDLLTAHTYAMTLSGATAVGVVAGALGTFAYLRKQSMISDAISHSALPGVLVAVLLLTAFGHSGRNLLGLVFSALFAVGVILVSSRLTDLHLDTHVVLVGDLKPASFDRWVVGGGDLGPLSLRDALSAGPQRHVPRRVLPAAAGLHFRPGLARLPGMRTGALDTAFMFLVAVTVTAAFHAAGALLIIALVVTPAATAQIFAVRMSRLIAWTLTFAGLGAVVGFGLAYAVDASTSTGMAESRARTATPVG